MKLLWLLIVVGLIIPCSAQAEGKKINVELTTYLPGLGIEYQLDEKNTLGINYSSIFQSVNINLTNYDQGAIQEGYYRNIFLGYANNRYADGWLFPKKFYYLGGVLGYQWMWDSGININADAGLMLITGSSAFGSLTGIAPAFAVSIGYAFSIE